jgi:hypothetical protein
MARTRAHVGVLTGLLIGFLGAGCASKASSRGDETHFQQCKDDIGCKNLGDAYRCVSGSCKSSDAGAGGSGGSGGSGASGSTGASGAGESVPDTGSPAVAPSAFCDALDKSLGDLDGGVVERLLGDAASTCTISASNYDRSCTEDRDCVEVGEGNSCAQECVVACANTAINVSAMPRYEADYARSPAVRCTNGRPFCGCPCIGLPACIRGTCQLLACGQSRPDAGPTPDAGPDSCTTGPKRQIHYFSRDGQNCTTSDFVCPKNTSIYADEYCGCGCIQDQTCPASVDCTSPSSGSPLCSDLELCPYTRRVT